MTRTIELTHRTAFELIPWYVTGTLDPAEADAVATHAEGCPACRAEIADQRRLAAALADTAFEETLESESWARIADRLDRPRGIFAWPRIDPTAVLRMVAVPAGAVAAGLVVWLALPGGEAPAPGFVTVTTPPAERAEEATAGSLRIRAAAGTDAAAIQARAHALGLRVVEGPSPTGLYRLVATTGDLDRAEAALRDDPGIETVLRRRAR
ncbi:MAG: zf-HC2 domain-containing protein [Paracoccaceae bacterium]